MKFEDLNELIQAIREHPEWREALLAALLPPAVLELPAQMLAFRQEHQEQMARLEHQIAMQRAEHEEQVAALRQEMQAIAKAHEERMNRIEERIEALRQEMLERIEALRQEMYAIAKAHEERMNRIEQRIAEMHAEFTEQFGRVWREIDIIKADIKAIQDDLSVLKGRSLEDFYYRRAPAIFGRYMTGVKVLPPDELEQMLEPQAPLSSEEADSLYDADLYVYGRRKSDRQPVIAVLEISWVADKSDVERARERAQIIARRGFYAIPVVAGNTFTLTAVESGETGEVVLLTDGRFKFAKSLIGTPQ
jgi:uncharacterized protein involved in tolerance to divalent cations